MVKYKEIYEKLRDDIISGVYPARTYLPKEGELMKMFSVSRDTIRKALTQLAAQGYIQKENGVGSLVLENKTETISFPVAGLVSFKELASTSMGQSAETIVTDFRMIHPDAAMQERLNVSASQEVQFIERVRKIDGERIILDRDYINPELIPGLKKEHAQNSLYEYIEQDLGLPVSFARKEITVIPASCRVKELLDLKDCNLVVCVRSYNYLENARLFDYTESLHRPDKFRFVDFSRRERMNSRSSKQS